MINSLSYITFILINYLLINVVVNGINWNGNDWAMSCDFRGNDLSNVRSSGEVCSQKCSQTKGCTHYAWNKYKGGTCWMKKGSISKTNALTISDPVAVCGVLTGNSVRKNSKPKKVGQSGDIINEGKFRCVFKDLDDKKKT